MQDNHDNDAPPAAPPGYHAAIGRKGAAANTPAQQRARVANLRRRDKLTPETRAALIAEYAAGASVAELVAKYEVKQRWVYRITEPVRNERKRAAEEAASNATEARS